MSAIPLQSLAPAPPAPVPVAPATVPEGVRLGSAALVNLTEAAGRKVAALAAREQQGGFLRIAISGGGL